MIRGRNLVGGALLWALFGLVIALAPASAEVIDRTIAVVNNHMVTWSDLDEQMRFEALQNGRALKDLGEADRHTAFDHIVDYQILRDQMQGSAPASAAEVAGRIAEIRAGWHLATGKQANEGQSDSEKDAEFARLLQRYGLSAVELNEVVTTQIEILKFMEFRVRPLVRASRREVEDYYTTTLVPQVLAAGQQPETLEQVTPKIRELIVEQKMNHEMETWMDSLRKQSSVQLLWDGVRVDQPK